VLSTVLDRLTTLASKHFIVGAFIPVLVFAFLNGIILYREFAWFSVWAGPQISGTARAFDAAALLIGLAVVAHVLWSLNGFLRQTLEGAHLRPDSAIGRYLRARQSERRGKLRQEYDQTRNTTARIIDLRPEWQKRLVQAALIGQKTKQNQYDGTGAAAATIEALRQRRVQALPLPLADLEAAVAALEPVLKANSISVPPPPGAKSTLSAERLKLLTLFDYAEEEWGARDVALANQLQARFGIGAIAPTAFGNVAESMQSYAFTRYRINLGTFWGRLQPILQKHEGFYSLLQDVKVQLDFLVACTWLSALTTLLWLFILPIWNKSAGLFLGLAIVGPAAAWLCYRAAIENYVGFGEVVRTGVDLYRLELLDVLRLPRPNGLREERALWDALRRVVSFGQEWVDVSYRREPGPTK
jgi:hypothetical protein